MRVKNNTKIFKQRYETPFNRIQSAQMMNFRTKNALNFRDTQKSLKNYLAQQQRSSKNKKLQRSFHNKISQYNLYSQKMEVNKQDIKYLTKGNKKNQQSISTLQNETQKNSRVSIKSIQWRHHYNNSTMEKDNNQFINNLPKNSIFYCCHCFQYVFQIQKKRHYPQCKDRLDISFKNNDQFRQIAWQRLNKIVTLAKYTNTRVWQIEELHKQICTHNYSKIFTVEYPKRPRFFTLNQIIKAFVYSYEQLLKGTIYKKSTIFTC